MRRRPPGRKRSAEDSDFARAVAAAAGPVLTPLGCRQKGHLPLWIADQRYWVILVDFQPKALTVGACFLWWVQSQWSFDDGVRVVDLGDAGAMAARAAEEVAAQRVRFASIGAIAAPLAARAGDASWPLYHAAIASGLAGDKFTALRLFERLLEKPATRDWEEALAAQARDLVHSLNGPFAFRTAVADVVARMRALQGLPRDPDCLPGML
jgi:hypothetical protein